MRSPTLLDAEPPEHVRAELLLGLAEGLARIGKGETAVRAASEAATLFRAQGRRAEAAWATYWEASGLYEMEQGDQSAALLERAARGDRGGLAVEPDLPVRALIALVGHRLARRRAGASARPTWSRPAPRLAELDDRKHAVFLHSLALSYRELGDFEAAISTGTQSLSRFKAAEADFEAASIENELALVYLAIGASMPHGPTPPKRREYFSGAMTTRVCWRT